MGLRGEHAQGTRRELLRAATVLFADRGFTGTSVRDVAEEARVTKGALYHHFGDKVGMFRAVYEEIEQELARDIVAAASGEKSPLAQLRRGATAYLDACLEPRVRRIVLLDGPSALGWEQWRQIDADHVLGLIKGTLRAMASAGQIAADAVDPLAHVLLGALNEAGMFIAHAPDPTQARSEVGRTIDDLLSGLVSNRC